MSPKLTLKLLFCSGFIIAASLFCSPKAKADVLPIDATSPLESTIPVAVNGTLFIVDASQNTIYQVNTDSNSLTSVVQLDSSLRFITGSPLFTSSSGKTYLFADRLAVSGAKTGTELVSVDLAQGFAVSAQAVPTEISTLFDTSDDYPFPQGNATASGLILLIDLKNNIHVFDSEGNYKGKTFVGKLINGKTASSELARFAVSPDDKTVAVVGFKIKSNDSETVTTYKFDSNSLLKKSKTAALTLSDPGFVTFSSNSKNILAGSNGLETVQASSLKTTNTFRRIASKNVDFVMAFQNVLNSTYLVFGGAQTTLFKYLPRRTSGTLATKATISSDYRIRKFAVSLSSNKALLLVHNLNTDNYAMFLEELQ